MKKFFCAHLFFILPLACTLAQSGQSPVKPGAELKKLADGFSFTEGPASDKDGNVYFTDQPNNKILKWSVNGELSVFMADSGRANGLYIGRDGDIYSCSDAENELWRIDAQGKYKVLVNNFGGKKLNGPNDLWIAPNGGIYFTDPLYGRPYWTRTQKMQQDGEHVYYLAPDAEKPVRIADDLEKPNGIVGTPDGKRLYVADIQANKTYVYNIESDGSLSGKKLFAPLGSDGMTIDSLGNIYLTGKGVTIFTPRGEQIGHIDVPEPWTANVCFGGKDMKTLFITASKSLYGIEMNVQGVAF